MRFLSAALILLLASSTLTSCGGTGFWGTTIRGSGSYTASERQVSSFDAIELSGGMQLDIVVGEEASVIIHADENLHDYITTTVKNNVLVIDFEESVSTSNELRAEISMPSLRSIEVSGSSKLELSGLQEPSLELDFSGSVSGNLSGEVERLSIDIAGSSNLNCYDLQAEDVEIDIAGSGKIRTSVKSTLNVDVAGSAVVLYRGQPSVSIDQAGSARVERDESDPGTEL